MLYNVSFTTISNFIDNVFIVCIYSHLQQYHFACAPTFYENVCMNQRFIFVGLFFFTSLRMPTCVSNLPVNGCSDQKCF